MAGVKQLPSGTWRGWFKHYEGHRAFFTLSRTATRREVLNAAHTLEVEHAQIRKGLRPRPDQQSAMLARPIKEVIEEYLAWGAFQGARGGRPWTPKHQRMRAAQLCWWQKHLHLRVLGDCLGILPDVERGLHTLTREGYTSQTVKHYFAGIIAFCRWCAQRNYLPLDPLAHRTPVEVTPRQKRRALTNNEIHHLLAYCPPAHRLLYETALVTGLRANELRQLSLEHLDIDGRGLHLDAGWTKNRQAGWQPLPSDLLARLYTSGTSGEPLKSYRRVRSRLTLPALPLLFVPRNTSVMLATDCRRADIPLQTSKGKVDFHALRTTAINLLFAQGATPPEAQALARHSTPALTVGVYGRAHDSRLATLVEEVATAIVPASQRASCVHAQAIGAPPLTQPRGEITSPGRPIMPLQLSLINTDSSHSGPKPRQNSPGDTGDPLRNHPSFRRPHQGQWNKGCCPP
jgi:integrase